MFHRKIILSQKDHAFYHVPSIVVAPDGSILAFCEERWRSSCDDTGQCHIVMKKSTDGGVTWGEMIYLRRKEGAKYHMGSAVADPISQTVLLMCGGGWLKSTDNGSSWQDWNPKVNEAKGCNGGSTHGSAPGIIKKVGEQRGRILWPARTIVSRDGYDDRRITDRRKKCYSIVLYSDDGGETIHGSNYFLKGTGEACLSERVNGDLYFNARAYWDNGKRYTAISTNGGAEFLETGIDKTLREIFQGCNASMVRYPPELCDGRDVLLFVNPDTNSTNREHGVVHVSEDGGETWPIKKEISRWGDWFDYSSMAVTPDGTILVMYKTTPSMQGLISTPDECCSMALARFDLKWIGL